MNEIAIEKPVRRVSPGGGIKKEEDMNGITLEKTVRDETLKDICDEVQVRLGTAWSSALSISEELMGAGMRPENESGICPNCLMDQLDIIRRLVCELSDILMKISERIC